MPISYAPTSWNPMVGCEPVSEGCKNCWAMKLHNQRYGSNRDRVEAMYGEWTGPETIRHARQHNDFDLPFPAQYDMPFANVQLLPARLSEPLRWRKPRTVAVCFMGDLFHEQVPDYFIGSVFSVMALAVQHQFLVLTKRPERMRRLAPLLPDIIATEVDEHLQCATGRPDIWPLPNVWLGVTAENQRMADERIPPLLRTPAAHRWASLEPLLTAVDVGMLKLGKLAGQLGDFAQYLDALKPSHTDGMGFERRIKAGLDWVVVGGESGPGHRPMDLHWMVDIADQCFDVRVPYYGKQASGARPNAPLPPSIARRELPWN